MEEIIGEHLSSFDTDKQESKPKPIKTNTYPVGVVRTPTGDKEISVMNDLFINYTFDEQKNNSTLMIIVNTFLNDYIKSIKPKETNIQPINGEIIVETQYTTMINKQAKTRSQDIKIEEEKDFDDQRITFLEFQNKASTSIPIANRAIEYFGLGVGKGRNSVVNQVWFMAESSEKLLLGRDYTNYIFKEALTNDLLPNKSSILFVNLQTLSKDAKDATVKDMAGYLLGKIPDSDDRYVKMVAESFSKSFYKFKDEKEVIKMIDWVKEKEEVAKAEGIAEGIAKGIAEGMVRGMVKLLYNDMNQTTKQIAEKLKISEEQVADIIDELNVNTISV